MNKKMIKILSVILMTVVLVSISVNSFALNSPNELTANSSVNGGTEITNLGQNAMGIMQTAGIVLSVLILIVLGIKYMMGSAEEKAEYKKTMIPYLVGAAFIFGASVIATVVFSFMTSL